MVASLAAGLTTFPHGLFVDKDGMIREQYEGRDSFLEESSVEKNIRAKVEEMLKQAAGTPKKTAVKKTSAKKSN